LPSLSSVRSFSFRLQRFDLRTDFTDFLLLATARKLPPSQERHDVAALGATPPTKPHPPAQEQNPMNALLDQTTDIFCEKLARLDAIGPNRRLIFTVSSVDEPGCHLVAAKLILPADFMVTLAYMAVSADRMTISPELIEAEPRMLN
jgi:hypothetical protein